MKARQLIFATGVAVSVVLVTPARAQDYPMKTITLIVPFAPGGGSDIVGRLVAQGLQSNLGQTVIVDNRGGAGGTVGTARLAKSPPDGYTLGLATSAALVANPNLRTDMPYDPVRDFVPITRMVVVPNVLVVHPSLPVKSVKDLIALAKRHPEQLTFSSSGVGGSGHLAGAMFNVMAAVNTRHIPYKSGSAAAVGVLNGEVTYSFFNTLTALHHMRAGRMRGVAVTSTKRSETLPDLPTVAESGLPGFEAGAWHGIAAPAGIPRGIVNRLSAELNKLLKNPAFTQKLTVEGGYVVENTPEQFAEHIKSELSRWGKIIKAANIRVN